MADVVGLGLAVTNFAMAAAGVALDDWAGDGDGDGGGSDSADAEGDGVLGAEELADADAVTGAVGDVVAGAVEDALAVAVGDALAVTVGLGEAATGCSHTKFEAGSVLAPAWGTLSAPTDTRTPTAATGRTCAKRIKAVLFRDDWASV